MSDDAKSIISHQEQLAGKRFNFDSWWQQIGERVLPSQATFTVKGIEQGEKRTERLFDANAVTANERFAAVMEDLLTPQTQIWAGMAPEDDSFEDDQEVKEYLEQVNKILFTMRYRPRANFISQKSQGYLSLGAFGNSCLFIDEIVGEGARYKQIHMSEVFWSENHQGTIDTLYRRFPFCAVNALRRFGMRLPEKIRSTVDKNPYQEFEFIHCVKPNESYVPGAVGPRGKPYSSYYVTTDERTVVEASGYSSWPYAIGRYMLAPNETYARSPAMAAWPAIMTINEEKKTILRAGQKEVDPPVLLQEDGLLEAFNMRAGALNYGAVSNDGTPLAVPFKSGANIPLGLELMNIEKQHIEDSFLVSLWSMIADENIKTAAQVYQLAQQKSTLLAPIMGRSQSEDLGPMIARELDIAAKANLLPPMPQQLLDRGAGYKIEYRSPLARMARAQDGLAIQRTFESVASVAQIKPDVFDNFDVDASAREIADINGMPAKLLRDPKEVQQIRQQTQQSQALQQAAEVAPQIAQTAKTAAEADQIRGAL